MVHGHYGIQPAGVEEWVYCCLLSHQVTLSAWQAHSTSSTVSHKAALMQPDLCLGKVQSPIQHLLCTSKLVFVCLKKRQKSTGVRSKNTVFVKRKIPLPFAEIFRRKDKQWQTRWKLGEPAVLVSAACRVVMLENPLVTALWKTCSSANVTRRHLFNNSSILLAK